MFVRYYTRKRKWTRNGFEQISLPSSYTDETKKEIFEFHPKMRRVKTNKRKRKAMSVNHLNFTFALWNAAEIETWTVTHNIKLENQRKKERSEFTESFFSCCCFDIIARESKTKELCWSVWEKIPWNGINVLVNSKKLLTRRFKRPWLLLFFP